MREDTHEQIEKHDLTLDKHIFQKTKNLFVTQYCTKDTKTNTRPANGNMEAKTRCFYAEKQEEKNLI